MRVCITGVAGFIGMHVALQLLERGDSVVGVDNLNDYYDVSLKEARLNRLVEHSGFSFTKADLADNAAISELFKDHAFERVVHLAAQAGVRYSLKNPHTYIDSNIQGFLNILEGCRHAGIDHLVYASSSSVYGGNITIPYSEHQNIDHPVSLYAATKKANELMAHSYSHLFGLPTTGLRFFTVYGPWGRPDMAPMLFADALINGKPIDVYNSGEMVRDFTYIDDIVEGVIRVLDKPATASLAFDPAMPDPATSNAPYRVFNLGNGAPTPLMEYIRALEAALGVTAEMKMLPMQPGDVPATAADTSELDAWVGFRPNTPVREGVKRFADWYLGHFRQNY